ncbi:unnamed protein product [Brassicogethes aeneus]|uniref:Ubinuclein-1 n=1 Tax=Brassicogethes aeneus TaxID=1431903 RepID=A0A9P0BCE7_BRAAE|nr:unnamed protein product [Brassicogethes aeneus]
MSDNKRIALTTFEPEKVSDKQCKKPVKTIRVSVILPESNEDNCPEYNFKDELAAVKKRSKLKDVKKDSNNVENGLDPFGEDDDDDVRRIARQMEEKYGTAVGGACGTANKKKRKGRKDDYADIGMGYDESDSFIDNTDGYDEIIPQNVTTLHGGFYINCGALEFKTDDEATSEISSDSSESDNEETVTENNQSTNRKRILDTTEDEDSDKDEEGQSKKKQKLSPKNTMQQAIKKKLFSQNKIQIKKRRPIDPLKKTVKELLREKRVDLNMSIPTELVVQGQQVVSEGSEKESHKENKKPMSISSVADAIESVVKATLPLDNNGNNKNLEISSSLSKPDVSLSYDSESSHDSKVEKVEVVKLPENLPADILETINSIKQAACEHKDGKVKFFNEENNKKLLTLERKCRCLGRNSKTKVYEHLSAFVRCKKETLTKRAKHLVFEDDQQKLKKMIVKLKAGINEIMPTLLANHEKESQKILQKKFSQESVNNEESKSLRMPHRKFQWNEDLRKLAKDIIATKKRCFLLEGKQKESIDELILGYLKSDIQTIWPDGWMSVAALRKACNLDIPSKNGTNNPPIHKKPTDSKTNSLSSDLKHSQKNSSLTLSTNLNLQIIPVVANVTKNTSSKSESVSTGDLTVSKISNNSTKACQKLPEKSLIITPSFNNEEEHKFFDFSKTIKLPEASIQQVDSSVIKTSVPREDKQEEHKEVKAVTIEPKHCQVIDLTEAVVKKKIKPQELYSKPPPYSKPIDYQTPMDFSKDSMKLSNKHSELSITPNFQSTPLEKTVDLINDGGDDIQKVMENLKALQQLSSPSKNAESSLSSPVSVIAYNKSFSAKTSPSSNNRTETKHGEFPTGFQDEFQKQFMNSLTHMSTPTTSKNNYNRCS